MDIQAMGASIIGPFRRRPEAEPGRDGLEDIQGVIPTLSVGTGEGAALSRLR
jgi:hypothetical protein